MKSKKLEFQHLISKIKKINNILSKINQDISYDKKNRNKKLSKT